MMDVPVNDLAAYHIAALRSLESLLLDSDLTDRGVGFLSNLVNLKELQVRGGVTRAGAAGLAELPRLKSLSVSSPYFTEADAAAIAAESAVEVFDSYRYHVSPAIGSAIPLRPPTGSAARGSTATNSTRSKVPKPRR